MVESERQRGLACTVFVECGRELSEESESASNEAVLGLGG